MGIQLNPMPKRMKLFLKVNPIDKLMFTGVTTRFKYSLKEQLRTFIAAGVLLLLIILNDIFSKNKMV